jgi:hypothetical protein
MKTNDFITALAADLPTRPVTVARATANALLVSVPIALGLLVYAVEVRPDFVQVLGDPRFLFKFVFTLAAAASGLWLTLRLSRPGAGTGRALLGLGLAAAVLVVGIGLELMALPSNGWLTALVGDRAVACMVLIPVLSAAPLGVLLYALKAGAPDDPALAGAAVGLFSGAIGATLYATHCTNDSPLFVATWYVIGIAAVTLIGSLVGSRVLRW